uniref:Secreted protein n=1 Tax=Takifugu rubripes TaxID=31033 RepID=A0A674N6G2_TAKRU
MGTGATGFCGLPVSSHCLIWLLRCCNAYVGVRRDGDPELTVSRSPLRCNIVAQVLINNKANATVGLLPSTACLEKLESPERTCSSGPVNGAKFLCKASYHIFWTICCSGV